MSGFSAFAILSAVTLVVAMAVSLPASVDYITFYEIKSSSILGIRLDIVFSVYAIFAIALMVRYAIRTWHLMRGADIDALDEGRAP